jgi:hypothetical protein
MPSSFEGRIVNDITPKWIRELRAEDEERERDRERVSQEQQVASLRIAAEAPDFWKQVLKEIKINVDSLSEIGLRGSLSPIERDGVHVEVARTDLRPATSYTNVFWSEHPLPRIRLHDMENAINGSEIDLVFGVQDNQVVVTPQVHPYKILNAEQTAEYIVKRLVGKVRR